MKHNNPLLFVHIPKTAGTSFREALQQEIGNEAIACDYGPDSPNTHWLIKKNVYENEDIFRLGETLINSGVRVIAGHFPVAKYSGIIPADRTIIFLRDPIQRTISHFEHYRRLKPNFNSSFSDFLQTNEAINFQTRLLGNIPLECIGFIGLTERYSESISLFNKYFNIGDLSILRANCNPFTNYLKENPLSPETLLRLIEANRSDILLLRRANKIFNARIAVLSTDATYIRGAIQEVKPKIIRGFAYADSQSEPISVTCEINGQQIMNAVKAVKYRPFLRQYAVPRNGYIGFEFTLRMPLKKGDVIVCKETNNGQFIDSFEFQN